VLATFGVLVIGTFLVSAFARQLNDWERQWLWGAFAMHLFMAAARWYVITYIYGFSDSFMYDRHGTELALSILDDPFQVFPQALLSLFQQDNYLSVFIPGDGSSTGSMVVLTGLLHTITFQSFEATSLAFMMLGFSGKCAIYLAFRSTMPKQLHRIALGASLLVPSADFWTAGIIKEAVAMAGFGPLLLSVVRHLEGVRNPLNYARFIAGVTTVWLVKPYILLVAAGGIAVYYYWHHAVLRGQVTIRPVRLVLAAVFALVGIYALGEVAPRFSLASLASETARLQEAGVKGSGGSNYAIGGSGNASFARQILLAPLGLLTALFRPLLIDVRNPMMAVNALETTGFLVLFGLSFARNRTRDITAAIVRYPVLSFAISFTAVFGVAVGLTSANLGSLSRYRVPLVPFYVLLLGAFGTREGRAALKGRAPSQRPTQHKRNLQIPQLAK